MDRRELTRAYRETRRPMGIFRVRNTANDRALVACSLDLPASLNRERAQLRFGAHRNAAMQQDWNALGADAFAFEVLDTLTPVDRPDWDPTDDLRALEELWLERLEPFDDRGYTPRPKRR